MSKITTIGDWKVYKTTNWGTSWNWVAMHKDTVIDNFPTNEVYRIRNTFRKYAEGVA